MKLAINYSVAARIRLEEGKIDFDIWKSAPRLEWMKEASTGQPARPLYIHFPFDLGEPDFEQTFDGERVQRLLEETGTFFVNVHLNARREHFPELDGETNLRCEWREVRDRFLRHLEIVTGRFDAEQVIAENVIYRGENGPFLRASVEPELICEVVQESGCRFLLDTAHAQMTCYYLGDGEDETKGKVESYLDALPCEHLRELHITGVQKDATGRWRDSMPMTNADWRTAGWVLKQTKMGIWPKPWAVALEYGGVGLGYEWRSDPDVITEQLPALGALMDKPERSSEV